jgi:DNA-directed RNA polymerase subunit K
MVEQEAMEYTKYEKARMIGSRALQISMGAPLMLELSKQDLESIKFNPIEIAKKEFEAGVIPLTIKRPLPGNKNKQPEAKK